MKKDNTKLVEALWLVLNGLCSESLFLTKMMDRKDNSDVAERLSTNAPSSKLFKEVLSYVPVFGKLSVKQKMLAAPRHVLKTEKEYREYINKCMQVIHNRICEDKETSPCIVEFFDFNDNSVEGYVDNNDSEYDCLNRRIMINASEYINTKIGGEEILINLYYQTMMHILTEKMLKVYYKNDFNENTAPTNGEIFVMLQYALALFSLNSDRAIEIDEITSKIESGEIEPSKSKRDAKTAMLIEDVEFGEVVSPLSLFSYMYGLEEFLVECMRNGVYNISGVGEKLEALAADFYKALSVKNATECAVYCDYNTKLFNDIWGDTRVFGDTTMLGKSGNAEYYMTMNGLVSSFVENLNRSTTAPFLRLFGVECGAGLDASDVVKLLDQEFYSRNPDLNPASNLDDEGFPIVEDDEDMEWYADDYDYKDVSGDDVDLSSLENFEDEYYETDDGLNYKEMPNRYNYLKSARERMTGLKAKMPDPSTKIGDNYNGGNKGETPDEK